MGSTKALIYRQALLWKTSHDWFNSECIKWPTDRIFCLFLDWALPKFSQLNQLFQSDKPAVAIMYAAVNSIYKEFLKSYIDSDYINRTPLENIDPSHADKFLLLKQMYLGVKVASFLQKTNLRNNENLKIDFFNDCKQFFIVSCLQIKQRFDSQDVVLQNISALKPSNAMLEKTRKTLPSLLSSMQALPLIISSNQNISKHR